MAVTQRLPAVSKGLPISKLLKPVYGLVAVGFTVALVHTVLGLSLIRQSRDEEVLRNEAEVSARTLASLKGVNLDQMQVDLTNAELKLAEARMAIPRDGNTTTFVSDLVATADRHFLELVSFQSGNVREQVYGMYKYQARLLTIVVSGTREDLTGFSASIESMDYPLLVRSAQFEVVGSNPQMSVDFELFSRASDEPEPTPAKGKAPAKPSLGSAK